MRLPDPAPTRPAGENIIPLINVVFLLLIFFMLTGSLGDSDLFRVRPPASVSTATPQPRPLQLLIGPGGRLALDGRRVTLANLAEAVAGHARDGAPPIRIKADRHLAVSKLMPVLKTLSGAGIDRVELLTIHKPGE